MADALVASDVRPTELICSPLQRAVQTAQVVERHFQLHPARDQRLTELSWGSWEGRTRDELADDPLYQQFLARPTDVRLPGGEGIETARRRAVAAVEQAISDATVGELLAIITHGDIIRMLLGHYMGAPASSYRRMRVDPGSISILSFGHAGGACVTAINWHSSLFVVLAGS